MEIDITFDFRSDSGGKDPDLASPTLRKYHQFLWSKPLPGGAHFQLELDPEGYLVHSSDLGRFDLSSDTISNSMRSHKRMNAIIAQISPAELDSFQAIGSTIGGKLLFPRNRVGASQTINVARGFNSKIADRIDLTLECIRLQYLGKPNPLAETLTGYQEFFGLFGDFGGYLDFFLLGDFATKDEVRPLIPFDLESGNPRTSSVEEYIEYKRNTMEAVAARNRRITSWVIGNSGKV